MKDKAILNICPEEEFFGREKEIDGICSRALSEGQVSSIYLWGGRKSGKTEILKRVYHRLFWRQDKVVPFYYAVKTNYRDPSGYAEDYLCSFVRQYLAFLKKDPLLIVEGLPLSRLERMAADEDMIGLTRLLTFHREGVCDKNYDAVLKNAVSAPHLISHYYQPHHQTRIFVILDDFHLLGEGPFSEGRADALREYPELLRSQLTPHLITGNRPATLNKLFKGGDLLDALDVQEIKGLDNEKGVHMLEGLCRIYGINYDKDVLSFAVRQLDGNPFYLRSVIRACQKLGSGLASLKEFMDIYTFEVMKGGIACYLSSLISSMPDGNDRMARLKILRTSIAAKKGITLEGLSERSGVRRDDLQELLKGMHLLGMVDTDSGMVQWAGEKVLADFVDTVYSMEIKGLSASQVRTEIVNKRLKDGFRLQVAQARGGIKEELTELLERFDGQKVSRLLFQNHDFISGYDKSDAGADFIWSDEEEPVALDGKSHVGTGFIWPDKEDTVTLPQVVGCFEREGGKGPGLYILEAQGFYDGRYEDGYESVWMIGVKDSPEAITAFDVAEFAGRCDSLIEKINAAGIVRWLIGRAGFSADSLEVIEDKGIFSSDYTQVRLLQRIMEDKHGHKTISGLMPLKEFEVVIPMAEDAELVAARALEEVAKKVGFDEDTVSHIKMAIIEACINAFEHSRVRDGKVSIKIYVERDRLVICVQNEGKVFDVSAVARPDIDHKIKSPDKRGWGIELMKGFMDEISFENVDGGTKLVMVKYIKTADEKAASVRGLKMVQYAS